MQILKVEPRSPEWLAARQDAWTASLAAVLAVPENARALKKYAAGKGVDLEIDKLAGGGGVTGFFGNTLWTVWADKQGRIPRFRGNADTERGVRNEEAVIALFEQEQMLIVEREVTAFAEGTEWLLASFDGLVPTTSDPVMAAPHGFPLEAKCPAFRSRKKLFDAKRKGGLAISGLPYYWCQVQHQCLVADAPYGWFVAAGLDDKTSKLVFPIMEKVPRDDEFLEQYEAAAKFYYDEFLYNGEEPPKLLSDEQLIRDLQERADFDKALKLADIDGAAELYFAALENEKSAIATRKALEAKLVEEARKRRSTVDEKEEVDLAGLLKVSFASASSVSWQKVAEKLAGPAGIPETTIKDCTGKARETVKIAAVEA